MNKKTFINYKKKLLLKFNNKNILSNITKSNNILSLLLIDFLNNNKFDKVIDVFFLVIIAGDGGKDACDCAKIIFNLYHSFLLKFINNNNFQLITINLDSNGSFKKGVFKIEYTQLFYLFKNEHGIHKIIRESPFKKQLSIQTSYVKVLIFPFISQKYYLLQNKNLLIETCKSTGAGGQHVNKTNSAVSILHKPTGIKVKIQTERSYHSNLILAKKFLSSKISNYHNINLQKQKKQIFKQKLKLIRTFFFTRYSIINHLNDFKINNKKKFYNFLKGKILLNYFMELL